MSCARSQTKNPETICKDCGSFDLDKIKFTENIDLLASKTEIFKTALVNQNREEKDVEELSKNDQVKVYKYNFENQQNQILGKKPFTYNNDFDFTDLTLLTAPDKKILAYEATVFYEGTDHKIDALMANLREQNKSVKATENQMEGDLTVYQWRSDKKIVQLVRANKPGKEEHTVGGKTTTRSTIYVKLNCYSEEFIKNSFGDVVKKDLNFVVFGDRHFKKQ